MRLIPNISKFFTSDKMSKGISRKKVIAKGAHSTSTGSSGTVTQIDTDNTLTGGPISSTGTIGVDLTHDFTWTGDHVFTQPVLGPGTTPVASNEFIDKTYADTFAQGLKVILACDLATTANIVLTGEQVIDGTLTVASRVLVKDQIAQDTNGIYTTAVGAWTRVTDYDTTIEVVRGTFTPVIGGTANGNTIWVQITDSPTINVDPLVFTQLAAGVSPTASLGVQKVLNDFQADTDGVTIGLTGNSLTFIGGSDDVLNDSNVAGSSTSDALDALLLLTSISLNNTLYVSKNGNDGTGTRNKITAPYLTIGAAKAAASSGDTIIVFPGAYTEAGITLTSGISYEFLGVGSLTASSGASVFIGAAGTASVNAPGWTFNGTGNRNIFATSAASTVKIVAKNILGIGVPAIYVNHTSSVTHIKADYITSTVTGWATITTDSGGAASFIVECPFIECTGTGSRGILLDSCLYGNFSGNKIVSTAGTGSGAVKVDNSGASDVCYFTFDSMLGGTGWTFWVDGAGEFFLNCPKLQGAGTCTLVSSSSTRLYAKGQRLKNTNAATYGLIHTEGTSVMTVEGYVLERDPAATGDDIDAETGTTIKLIGVDYDPSKVEHDGTITVIAGVPTYSAIISQSGSSAPTVNRINTNNTRATITYTYTNAGEYVITSDTAIFKNGKIRYFCDIGISTVGGLGYSITRLDDNNLTFQTPNGGFNQDNQLLNSNLTIEIYP